MKSLNAKMTTLPQTNKDLHPPSTKDMQPPKLNKSKKNHLTYKIQNLHHLKNNKPIS